MIQASQSAECRRVAGKTWRDWRKDSGFPLCLKELARDAWCDWQNRRMLGHFTPWELGGKGYREGTLFTVGVSAPSSQLSAPVFEIKFRQCTVFTCKYFIGSP